MELEELFILSPTDEKVVKRFLKFVPPDDRLRPVVAEVAWLDLMTHRHVGVDEEGDAVAEVDLLPSRDLNSDCPGAMFAGKCRINNLIC